MEYQGYRYVCEPDVGDDVIKLEHYAFKDGKLKPLDLSPYEEMTQETFRRLVDLHFADRLSIGSISPLTRSQIKMMAVDAGVL